MRTVEGTPSERVTAGGRFAGGDSRPAGAAEDLLDEALRQSFTAGPIGAALVDGDDRFVAVNAAFSAMVGRSAVDLLAATLPSVVLPDDRGGASDQRFVHPDGRVVWAQLHLTPIAVAHRRGCRLIQLTDITSRTLADATMAAETVRLRDTIRVQREVTAAARERDATIKLVAERSISTFPAADGAVVELLDGSALRYAAATGTMGAFEGVSVAIDSSLSGLAVSTATTMRCDDPETDGRVDLAACRRVGLRSMIIAPLFAESRTIGVLKVTSSQPHAFDDNDVHQLELLAESLSSALRHADDYSEITRLLAERTAAVTELEAANHLKLDLIGMLGHEIGTPLTSILGSAEVAVEDWPSLSDQRRGRLLEVISRQAHRVNRLVREVLTMVTLDAGQITAHRTAVPMRAAVQAAINAADAGEPPVVCSDDLIVSGHPGHVQQILVNLLTNAAKYGRGATRIEVTADDSRARVHVIDQGAGVPPEFHDRLFSRFGRADRRAGTPSGTGLGLYIVRGLAEANHGSVTFTPNLPSGAIFTLELDRYAECHADNVAGPMSFPDSEAADS